MGGFIIAIFKSIGIDAERFFEKYLIIYGGCAAALISIYLADAKKSVVENFALISPRYSARCFAGYDRFPGGDGGYRSESFAEREF